MPFRSGLSRAAASVLRGCRDRLPYIEPRACASTHGIITSRHKSSMKPQSEPFFEHIPEMTTPATDEDIKVTELDNGVRIITRHVPGAWCNVSALFNAGARNETTATSGAAYFVDRLLFKATAISSHDQVQARIEAAGSDIMTISNREHLLVSANVLHRHADDILGLMLEAIVAPKFRDEDIEAQRRLIPFEEEHELLDPKQKIIEMVHQAAFQSGSLGHDMRPTAQAAEHITSATLHQYHEEQLSPDRIVIAATGMEHDLVVQSVTKLVGPEVLPRKNKPHVTAPCEFVGGSNIVQAAEPLLHPALQTPLSHFAIAFKAPPYLNLREFAPYAVLQSLLGGGSAFSSGGPGKGMYSWLYTKGLNLYYWTETLSASLVGYADASLFVLHSACSERMEPNAVHVLLRILVDASLSVPHSELVRARNQLKANMMTNFESRAVSSEDLSRQLAMADTYHTSKYICDLIDEVTAQEVQAAAKTMLLSPAAIAGLSSDTSRIPTHNMLQEYCDQMFAS